MWICTWLDWYECVTELLELMVVVMVFVFLACGCVVASSFCSGGLDTLVFNVSLAARC